MTFDYRDILFTYVLIFWVSVVCVCVLVCVYVPVHVHPGVHAHVGICVCACVYQWNLEVNVVRCLPYLFCTLLFLR